MEPFNYERSSLESDADPRLPPQQIIIHQLEESKGEQPPLPRALTGAVYFLSPFHLP